jgi:hypothetical protein
MAISAIGTARELWGDILGMCSDGDKLWTIIVKYPINMDHVFFKTFTSWISYLIIDRNKLGSLAICDRISSMH